MGFNSGFKGLISNFSKSFDITGNNEIGLYDAASCGGFPGFGILITSATFHSLGTYFSLKAALIRLVIFIIAFLGSCCRTSPVMRSNPGAFFRVYVVVYYILDLCCCGKFDFFVFLNNVLGYHCFLFLTS